MVILFNLLLCACIMSTIIAAPVRQTDETKINDLTQLFEPLPSTITSAKTTTTTATTTATTTTAATITTYSHICQTKDQSNSWTLERIKEMIGLIVQSLETVFHSMINIILTIKLYNQRKKLKFGQNANNNTTNNRAENETVN